MALTAAVRALFRHQQIISLFQIDFGPAAEIADRRAAVAVKADAEGLVGFALIIPLTRSLSLASTSLASL